MEIDGLGSGLRVRSDFCMSLTLTIELFHRLLYLTVPVEQDFLFSSGDLEDSERAF